MTAVYLSTRAIKMQLFSFLLQENSADIMHLIPVIDLNGQAKMFDLISGTYPMHYGIFEPGPEVKT